jgi:hypothetical protein
VSFEKALDLDSIDAQRWRVQNAGALLEGTFPIGLDSLNERLKGTFALRAGAPTSPPGGEQQRDDHPDPDSDGRPRHHAGRYPMQVLPGNGSRNLRIAPEAAGQKSKLTSKDDQRSSLALTDQAKRYKEERQAAEDQRDVE